MEGNRESGKSAERARSASVLEVEDDEPCRIELRKVLVVGRRLDPFLGLSQAIRTLERLARKVAATDRPVLLVGRTGCGKGVLARWIHEHGPRAKEPFVELNCAGLDAELLASELFGHARGAFTGAAAAKPGLLEVADRGTLFLDEIGDMDLAIQAKLLKVLEEQTFRRVGEVGERRVDLRLVAATHHDLDELVAEGRFRSDLNFRVNTLTLEVPPLCERLDDLPILVDYFVERLGRELGRPGLTLSAAAMEDLVDHDWPGNLRELRNVLERAVLLGEGEVVGRVDLRLGPRSRAPDVPDAVSDLLSLSHEELDKLHVEWALERAGGSMSLAARRLGIQRSTLYSKIRKYGIAR